ncbi:MAG: carbohydrate kinase [Anaerolineae bacterium]
MPDVICIGELLVDFVSTARNVPLGHAPGFTRAPGGAPANVAVALRRLGLSSGFVGKVGDDPFGAMLRETLEENGVDASALFVDAEARTTLVFVGVWDDGRKEMTFYRHPGADMRLRPEEITPALFEGARAFHYGSITLINEPGASAQRKALQMARERGLMISYDPNFREDLWPDREIARRVIQDAFQYAHLAKISEEEWAVATGHDDLDAGIEAVLARGPELLVISRGSAGAVATNGRYWIAVPAVTAIDVVETTGAGDAFMAAMIYKLLPERERYGSLADVPEETVRAALTFASAVGGLACTRAGAIPALPTLAEVEAFMAARGLA